jgi:hypothetical protein
MLGKQQIVDTLISEMEYPFSFLRNGEYPRKTEPIPGCPTEEIDVFPDNIAEYYWISPGENDEKPWMCLCRLTNGVYVFYMGECDYTGFDCQGNMKIYAARDPVILFERAMADKEVEKYKQDVGFDKN